MKFRTIFCLIFIYSNLFSQDYKIIYEFKWKSELNDKNYNSELTTLIKNDKKSYFESLTKFKYDSLVTTLALQGNRSFPSPQDKWKLQTLIIKDSESQTTTVEQEFFDKVYLTKYNCKPNWTIKDNKNKFFGYNVQKAETEFGGRKWIAWFSNEIPINDGPYNFFGLPGLILKVNDSEENFIFEIKGITKDEKNNIEKRNPYSPKVNLTPKQWETFWTKYQKEPSMIFATLNSPNNTFSYVYNGKNVDSKEAKESYNKAEFEKINLFKNPIELKKCE